MIKFSLASTIQATKEEFATIHRTNTNIPAQPSIFSGRDSYMTTILELIGNKTKLPIRAGILGPGGIGKTTLALAILHHPIVAQTFNERIYFVSCEGCLSISMLVKDLAKALGIGNDLEGNAIEENTFLKKIASLKDTSFVITMRGLEYPEEILWSHPLLPPLKPLSFEASKDIFQQLSNQWDEWTEKLVKAVEGLPLAITIIGHLAQSCDCKSLWKQWQDLNIGLLERGKGPHRLTSLETSIQLSIEGNKLSSQPAALFLLSLLGTLPGGLSLDRLSDFQFIFEDIQGIKEGIKPLLYSSLVYMSFNTLHLHPLIQYYIQEHLPLSKQHRVLLEKYYIELSRKDDTGISKEQLLEYKNTGYILLQCAKNQVPDESIVDAITSYSWLVSVETGSFINELFEVLEEKEELLPPQCTISYQLRWGVCLERCDNYEQAQVKYLKALHYAQMQQDEEYQAEILKDLGDLHSILGDSGQACIYWKQAMPIFEKLQNIKGQAFILSQLSADSTYCLLYEDGKNYAVRSIELYQSINDKFGIGNAWLHLGEACRLDNNMEKARECFFKSLDVFTKSNSR
ncbi:hypothetical protein FA95DRAFT_1578810, partial [Auriscalpium vulgare]